ncbi:MAG TPA: hypothetical protein V6D47_00960, partial [Oscillatoriaceae cyanobacterium]
VTTLPTTPVALADTPAPSQTPTMPTDSTQLTPTPTAGPAPADLVPPATLTSDEQKYLSEGLLPTNYAELKAIAQAQGKQAAMDYYRQGKQGPFADNYGDPSSMLSAAKRISGNPQLLSMFKDTKKGDIILIDYNDPNDFIAHATKGPFAHAIICTDAGPPPQFVEAMGMTGDPKDPSGNRVRRTDFNDQYWGYCSYRKISPADTLPEPQRSQAIDKAVNYAVKQLGKPYDYTLGQTSVGQAFYCSSLAYYAYLKGAGLKIPISKSSQRDSLIDALVSMTDGLDPKDRLKLLSTVMETVNSRPKPTEQQLINMAVTQILPNCYTTEALAKTPQQQAAIKAAIAKFTSGQGMPRFSAASQKLAADEKAGKFKTPVLGFFRKLGDQVRCGWDAALDVFHAFDGTGVSRYQAFKDSFKLAWAALPYSEVLCGFMFGQKDSRTRFFGGLLNFSEWFKNHKPFSWVSGWLPGRGAMRVDNDFISPTDLAWAKVPYHDYDLKKGQSIGPPKSQAS